MKNIPRKGWTNLAIPNELYDQVKRAAKSKGMTTNGYGHFLVRLGVTVDSALQAPEKQAFRERIQAILDSMLADADD